MTQEGVSMSALELQDVTHQLVQQFIAELQEMLPDLIAGGLSAAQKKVLQKIVTFFDQEMKEHHLEEELHIFPLLLSKGDAQLSEKVQMLKADHNALRLGWQELKHAIEQTVESATVDPAVLCGRFERYSACFARHLVLEESIQFSADARSLFDRWDTEVVSPRAATVRHS